MATIDYGALLKINGKIVNKDEFFMDMQKAVGWVDYPRIRYEDCDCINEEGCSCCGDDCPRAQRKHMSHPKLGEWDHVTGDCRGNPIRIDGRIDGNYFAYAGDEDFTVAVYKTGAVFVGKAIPEKFTFCDMAFDYEDWHLGESRMVKNFSVQIGNETVFVKVKRIAASNRQFFMSFRYKGNLYQLVYGYGIDSDKKVWDEVKTHYSNKKVIRFVDEFWKES